VAEYQTHSIADVVSLTGLSKGAVRRAIETKQLEVIRVGDRVIRVSDAALRAFLGLPQRDEE